jgi:general stress protein 26
MNQELINQANKIVKENSVEGGDFTGQNCTLTLIDDEGYPTTCVITPSKSDGINWIIFCTLLDGNRAKRALNNSRASVCFGTAEHCVNLVGDIEVITSQDVKDEMWYDALNHHFNGQNDPNYCVLKFTAKRCKLFIGFQEAEGVL